MDIETFSSPLSIRCVGYTAIFADGSCSSVVIPCDSLYNLSYIRKFNWEIKCPKVLQNGKYDIAYLQMYNAPLYNYLYDTAALFHSWYSELPKDLATLNAFCVREAVYWKDLAETSDLETYYLYNAKDTWVTALACISIIREAPQWALDNYSNEFPLQFPCHLSEMTGIKRDVPSLSVQCKELELSIKKKTESLSRQLGVSEFNVASPVQMKQLLAILGCKDLESADAKNLAKQNCVIPSMPTSSIKFSKYERRENLSAPISHPEKNTKDESFILSIRMAPTLEGLQVESIISGADSKFKMFHEVLLLSEPLLQMMDSELQNAISNKLSPETLRTLQGVQVLLTPSQAREIFTASMPLRFLAYLTIPSMMTQKENQKTDHSET